MPLERVRAGIDRALKTMRAGEIPGQLGVPIRRSPGNPRTIRYSLPGSARCGHRSQVHRDRSNTDRRCCLGGELQWRRNFEAWGWEQQEHREIDAATKSIAASPRLRPTRSKTSKPAAR
jgi:hypothetical protein